MAKDRSGTAPEQDEDRTHPGASGANALIRNVVRRHWPALGGATLLRSSTRGDITPRIGRRAAHLRFAPGPLPTPACRYVRMKELSTWRRSRCGFTRGRLRVPIP